MIITFPYLNFYNVHIIILTRDNMKSNATIIIITFRTNSNMAVIVVQLASILSSKMEQPFLCFLRNDAKRSKTRKKKKSLNCRRDFH
jgi:hypothetical protein